MNVAKGKYLSHKKNTSKSIRDSPKRLSFKEFNPCVTKGFRNIQVTDFDELPQDKHSRAPQALVDRKSNNACYTSYRQL